MKKATMSILASAVISTGLIAATSSFADETTTPSTDSSTDTVIVNPGDLQPMDPGNLGDMKASILKFNNTSIYGQADSKDFNIPAGYGWVKVWVHNAGSQPLTFTVNQGSPSGAEKFSGRVPAHQALPFYSKAPLATGLFYVSFSSSGDMEGSTASVRLATSRADLD